MCIASIDGLDVWNICVLIELVLGDVRCMLHWLFPHSSGGMRFVLYKSDLVMLCSYKTKERILT